MYINSNVRDLLNMLRDLLDMLRDLFDMQFTTNIDWAKWEWDINSFFFHRQWYSKDMFW